MSRKKAFLNAEDFQEAGGFLAVAYLKNRDSTGDIDYLIDPEFAKDKEIQDALQRAIDAVSDKLNYEEEWINERTTIFVKTWRFWQPPLEWALERKLRRIYSGDRGRKADLDITDAVALLESLRERSGAPLDMESIRRMNWNGFDVLPDVKTMEMVAAKYRAKYNREIFK
ncbi:uncharacterized protein N7483_005264 [Penicillium malachiteum]|uniref:uncharacterized protein n=1 Tax=Penicillium malachiteum TaxID=1324776 RepID=UPI0025499FA1|nr:uncharacterized protein N7483_005264 [Penicillium malachiteum]KAJ5730756.1 hypothetical protein N7483_005264 [Penicillium malachiteum]